jgi:hypothetical protein
MVYTWNAGPSAMTPETFLGYLSALHWVTPHLDLPTLLGTTVTLHVCDGIMCRLFAHNNGYPERLWMLVGFAFGIWAVAVLIVLPRRTPHPQHAPHA